VARQTFPITCEVQRKLNVSKKTNPATVAEEQLVPATVVPEVQAGELLVHLAYVAITVKVYQLCALLVSIWFRFETWSTLHSKGSLGD